jgi:hypothetical protein
MLGLLWWPVWRLKGYCAIRMVVFMIRIAISALSCSSKPVRVQCGWIGWHIKRKPRMGKISWHGFFSLFRLVEVLARFWHLNLSFSLSMTRRTGFTKRGSDIRNYRGETERTGRHISGCGVENLPTWDMRLTYLFSSGSSGFPNQRMRTCSP